MPLPDYEFDDFLDDECGLFVNGYSDGNFDVRVTTVDGEFFLCIPQDSLLVFMRDFFSADTNTNATGLFRF